MAGLYSFQSVEGQVFFENQQKRIWAVSRQPPAISDGAETNISNFFRFAECSYKKFRFHVSELMADGSNQKSVQ